MPEAYTHIRTGRRALAAAGLSAPCGAAFALGCQGPDLLFCYQVWKKGAKRLYDLPALGGRMHRERTGEFLQALMRRAVTDAQQSYAMGFLCHYAADCTLHPYVGAVTKPGRIYGMAGGHGYFEAALDSALHKADCGSAAVPRRDSCPPLSVQELAEVNAQLQGAVNEAFGLEIPRQPFADSYHHTRALRAVFVSRLRISYAAFWLAERVAFGGAGFITGHVTPRRLKKGLPAEWAHPAGGDMQNASLADLLQKAEEDAAALVTAFCAFRAGGLDWADLCEKVGANSYETGRPWDAAPGGKAAQE